MSYTKLFRLLELTRNMPQYGYVLAGISKNELSDLAQHHYLVAMIAWQLARACQQNGSSINLARVLEISLTHDLGEIFGSDISMPYARANEEARTYAKQFERSNLGFLAHDFFTHDEQYFTALVTEEKELTSDEAIIVKIADMYEVTHYKALVAEVTSGDIEMAVIKINKVLAAMQDERTKQTLQTITNTWAKEIAKTQDSEILEAAKHEQSVPLSNELLHR